LKPGKASVGDVDSVEIAHEEHHGDAWHQAPIDLADDFLVEGFHFGIAHVTKEIKAALNLAGREGAMLNMVLELDVDAIFLGDARVDSVGWLLLGRHFGVCCHDGGGGLQNTKVLEVFDDGADETRLSRNGESA